MRGWWRRMAELIRPAQLDREAVEELTHHIDLLRAKKMTQGLDEHEARRQALVEAGSVSAAREQIAEERTGFVLDQVTRELRHTTRVLRRSPGVTVLSVVTMGVGIGISAILLTLVNGIVLRPLPYPQSDRLVRIFDTNPQTNINRAGVATGNVNDWRRRATAFEGIAGYYVMGRTVSFDNDSDVLITAQVTEDFFDVLGVPPIVGRAFTKDETHRALFNVANSAVGADPVVMLSHETWVQRFGRDPNIVGRILLLERRPFRIVGVMPAAFAMPDAGVQLWIPWGVPSDDPRDQHYLGAVARLSAGVSVGQAEDALNTVARELGAEYPATNRGWGVRISPLRTEVVGDISNVLWVLLAAVGVVLLIACANVSLLALIRGLDRREETAVRLALGASTARLVREFLWESALLALVGGVAGAAIAATGLHVLPILTPNLPRLSEVVFDVRALTFVIAMTSLSAILSGLPQAWRRTRLSPSAGRLSTTLRSTESVETHRLRDGIVVMHVTMAVVLLTGSGLLIRSFLQLRRTDPGFDPRGVLVAPVFLDSQAYNSGEKARTYYRRLFAQLSALPGVVAVGGATTVPTSPLGPDFERPVWPAGSSASAASRIPASVRMVTPGYFKAIGLRVADGRPIDDRDAPQAPRVLMVSQTLARRMWPGQSAVGKQLMVDYSTSGVYPYEVVGVVGDVKFSGPRSEPGAEIYLPHAQRSYLILNVVVKTAGDPRAIMPFVRAALRAVDPQKPAQGLYPLEDLIGATYVRDRQAMITLLVFASAVICLAVLSIYGVLSQRVRERSREISIRMALGADATTVVGWVAGSGLRLIAVGLVIGALAARALSGALAGLLFGVAATDVLTTLGAAGAIATVGTLAILVPAWQATRIEPIHVLKRG